MRLIDADVLMKNIGKIPQLRGITYGRMKRAVEETPTIDAVPVVRCKDGRRFKRWHRKRLSQELASIVFTARRAIYGAIRFQKPLRRNAQSLNLCDM